MTVQDILTDWKKSKFKPVYWLEGEEEFFIDEVMDYAENHLLSDAEAEFNKNVFYGKDANWTEVVNAARRYPMFAEKQLVLLKEAQQMSEIEKLESYFSNPSPTTIFVASYKGKTIDKRSKLSKILKEKASILSSTKLYDNKLPGWVEGFVNSKGYSITPTALYLLVDHIGNDLSRIANEIEKLSLNLGNNKIINEDAIESFVGISKEYNVNELQRAICAKDMSKAIKIVQYFESNPKAGPIQLILPSLYNFFSKVLLIFQYTNKTENSIKGLFYNNPNATQDALRSLKYYDQMGVQQVILLLHEYNLKSLGINSSNDSKSSLIKELVIKLIRFTGK